MAITITIPDRNDTFWKTAEDKAKKVAEKLGELHREDISVNPDYVGHYRINRDGKEIVKIINFFMPKDATDIEKIAQYNNHRKMLAEEFGVEVRDVKRDYLVSHEYFGKMCLQRMLKSGLKENHKTTSQGMKFLSCSDFAYTMKQAGI